MQENNSNDEVRQTLPSISQATILPAIPQLPSISTSQIGGVQPVFSAESQFALWGLGSNQLLQPTGGLLGLSNLSLSSIPTMPMHPSSFYSSIDRYSTALADAFEVNTNAIMKAIHSPHQSEQNQSESNPPKVKRFRTKPVVRIPRNSGKNSNRGDDQVSNSEETVLIGKRQRVESSSNLSIKSDNSQQSQIPLTRPVLENNDRKLSAQEKTVSNRSTQDAQARPQTFEDFGRILDPSVTLDNTELIKRNKDLFLKYKTELSDTVSMYNNNFQSKNSWDIIAPVTLESLCPAMLLTYYSTQEQEDEFGDQALYELASLSTGDLSAKVLALKSRAQSLDELLKVELAKSRSLGLIPS